MSGATRDIFPEVLQNFNDLDAMLSDFWCRFKGNAENFKDAKHILQHFLESIKSLQDHIKHQQITLQAGDCDLDDLSALDARICHCICFFTKRRRDLEEIADLLEYLNKDMHTKSMMPWFEADS